MYLVKLTAEELAAVGIAVAHYKKLMGKPVPTPVLEKAWAKLVSAEKERLTGRF